ncbi:MAG: hypothetical protein FJY37_18940, partial [Betaproteobacteria bacterium]|nr:hypothetical protein [Betaproteobacteria bacterium]
MKRKSVKRPKQPQKTACKWNSAEWDGMSERQAFDEDPIEVMSKMGKVIASQTWRNGSWSTVYEYKGRFFSVD